MRISLLIIGLIIAWAAPGYGANQHGAVTLICRYDDFSSRSATYLDEKVINLFKKYHLALTVGVIPCVATGIIQDPAPQDIVPLGEPQVDILRQAMRSGTVDVALHGFSHQNLHRSFLRKPTEFAQLPYDCQFARIRAGKVFLEKTLGVTVDIFIPPFGTYDANTLLALEKLRFRCLSANLSGYADPATPLKFLPNTCELYQLRDVLTYAQRIARYQPLVCVVFHEYDFHEINYEVNNPEKQMNFRDFEDLIQWIVLQKDIQIKTMDQVIREGVDLSVTRFITNKYHVRLAHLKPAFWPPFYGYYLPSNIADEMDMTNICNNYNINRIKNILFIILFYGIFMTAFFLFFWILGVIVFYAVGPPPWLYSLIRYTYPAVLLAIIGYLIFFSRVHYWVLLPLVSFSGMLLGVLVSCPKPAKPGRP